MSFFDLERAIRRGVSQGIGRAVGNAIGKAIEPTATDLANKAAGHIDNAAGNQNGGETQGGGFQGAFANLERSVNNYATEAAKNMKVCPNCEKPTTADKKFCPECGTALPEQTVAEGAVCTACGKQNAIGTKFCQDCGAKLPSAIAEEQAQADKNAKIMAEWDEKLSAYPKWNCGGSNYYIEDYGDYITFSADFKGNHLGAANAVEQYRQILMQNGFTQAGQYPSIAHLYKKIGDTCYHVDTEHCFEGDPDCPNIGFNISEPSGGFDYVKPEPKQGFGGIKDLFGF